MLSDQNYHFTREFTQKLFLWTHRNNHRYHVHWHFIHRYKIIDSRSQNNRRLSKPGLQWTWEKKIQTQLFQSRSNLASLFLRNTNYIQLQCIWQCVFIPMGRCGIDAGSFGCSKVRLIGAFVRVKSGTMKRNVASVVYACPRG